MLNYSVAELRFFEKTAEAATNYIVDYWLDGEESQNVG